jgi:hypothetical protein
MTLHSVASCYPDRPSQYETTLMQTWLDMFQTTITCPSCREHFGVALTSYRRQYPRMLSSREEFLVATFRLHNAVNRRLNKPIHASVAACFEQLRNNVRSRTARDYRIAYINHIQRFWRTMQDVSGITALKKINEMRKIEYEYLQRHENNFEIDIPENTVVLISHALDAQTEIPNPIRIDTRSLPKIGFSGGRFQTRRGDLIVVSGVDGFQGSEI